MNLDIVCDVGSASGSGSRHVSRRKRNSREKEMLEMAELVDDLASSMQNIKSSATLRGAHSQHESLTEAALSKLNSAFASCFKAKKRSDDKEHAVSAFTSKEVLAWAKVVRKAGAEGSPSDLHARLMRRLQKEEEEVEAKRLAAVREFMLNKEAKEIALPTFEDEAKELRALKEAAEKKSFQAALEPTRSGMLKAVLHNTRASPALAQGSKQPHVVKRQSVKPMRLESLTSELGLGHTPPKADPMRAADANEEEEEPMVLASVGLHQKYEHMRVGTYKERHPFKEYFLPSVLIMATVAAGCAALLEEQWQREENERLQEEAEREERQRKLRRSNSLNRSAIRTLTERTIADKCERSVLERDGEEDYFATPRKSTSFIGQASASFRTPNRPGGPRKSIVSPRVMEVLRAGDAGGEGVGTDNTLFRRQSLAMMPESAIQAFEDILRRHATIAGEGLGEDDVKELLDEAETEPVDDGFRWHEVSLAEKDPDYHTDVNYRLLKACEKYNIAVPGGYLDPVNEAIMMDPVNAGGGCVMERSSYVTLTSHNLHSITYMYPKVTGEAARNIQAKKFARSNHVLRRHINEWRGRTIETLQEIEAQELEHRDLVQWVQDDIVIGEVFGGLRDEFFVSLTPPMPPDQEPDQEAPANPAVLSEPPPVPLNHRTDAEEAISTYNDVMEEVKMLQAAHNAVLRGLYAIGNRIEACQRTYRRSRNNPRPGDRNLAEMKAALLDLVDQQTVAQGVCHDIATKFNIAKERLRELSGVARSYNAEVLDFHAKLKNVLVKKRDRYLHSLRSAYTLCFRLEEEGFSFTDHILQLRNMAMFLKVPSFNTVAADPLTYIKLLEAKLRKLMNMPNDEDVVELLPLDEVDIHPDARSEDATAAHEREKDAADVMRELMDLPDDLGAVDALLVDEQGVADEVSVRRKESIKGMLDNVHWEDDSFSKLQKFLRQAQQDKQWVRNHYRRLDDERRQRIWPRPPDSDKTAPIWHFSPASHFYTRTATLHSGSLRDVLPDHTAHATSSRLDNHAPLPISPQRIRYDVVNREHEKLRHSQRARKLPSTRVRLDAIEATPPSAIHNLNDSPPIEGWQRSETAGSAPAAPPRQVLQAIEKLVDLTL